LVNLRRYLPNPPEDVPKITGLAGRGRQVYPDVPPGSWTILCEGEWDALVCRSHGLPSVTSTAGAEGWHALWDERLTGKKVAVIYDSQAVSREAAAKRATALRRYGVRVVVVDLAPDDDEGYDLTDWFRSGKTAQQLRNLISRTAALESS
jgi:hypothetical protein